MDKPKNLRVGYVAVGLVAAVINLVSTAPAHANLVLDPGFEASSPGDALDGPWFGHWAGPVDATSRPPPHAPHNGLQSAQFLNRGYLRQEIPTTPGQMYTFSFWLSGDGNNWEGERFRAYWDGNLIFEQWPVLGSDWAFHSLIEIARDTVVAIEFQGESHVQLDDVSVSLIPEPTTPALLVFALAVLGFSRRKQWPDLVVRRLCKPQAHR